MQNKISLKKDPIISLSESQIEQLIEKIKEKKELEHISASFVAQELSKFLIREFHLQQQLVKNFHEKSASFRITVKKVRELLRRSYGLFRGEKKAAERKEVMKKMQDVDTSEAPISQALTWHSSTDERRSFYVQLYTKIFQITGKPNKILDLGSGLNPLSIGFMRLRKLHYHALDINEEEVKLLNIFFEQEQKKKQYFSGKAEIFDITNTAKLSLLPAHDLAFLLKMSDILDKGHGHRMTELVIKSLPVSWVVVSFPTLTMSGKKMNYPRRKWIELMSQRLGYDFKLVEFENELFYVIQKI